MKLENIRLLLADDDEDDCFLFKEALNELHVSVSLTTVHDGEQLMLMLAHNAALPQLLILDLNMPRKNGFECLAEIKKNDHMKDLPVVIFSTSFDSEVINKLYRNGAHLYIRKPSDFSDLKKAIRDALCSLPLQAGIWNMFLRPERLQG